MTVATLSLVLPCVLQCVISALGQIYTKYFAVVRAAQVSVTWQFDGPLFIFLSITNIYCSHPSRPTWFRVHSKHGPHTCYRRNCSGFEYKEFLEATIPFMMCLLCLTKETTISPFSRIDSCCWKMFLVSILWRLRFHASPVRDFTLSLYFIATCARHSWVSACQVCVAFPHNNN